MLKDTIQGPWESDGTLVFFADGAGGFDLRNCPHPEEKARLAAAAPDMLAALLRAKSALNNAIPGAPQFHADAVAVVDAAILLATGERHGS